MLTMDDMSSTDFRGSAGAEHIINIVFILDDLRHDRRQEFSVLGRR